jgi:hypothetical protein
VGGVSDADFALPNAIGPQRVFGVRDPSHNFFNNLTPQNNYFVTFRAAGALCTIV